MAKGRITLRKVELAEAGLTELLDCAEVDLSRRAVLAQALTVVRSLRPAPDTSVDHSPLLVATGTVGCTCGFRPDKRPTRISMIRSPYRTHLARIGIRDDDRPIIRGFGPNAGQPL